MTDRSVCAAALAGGSPAAGPAVSGPDTGHVRAATRTLHVTDRDKRPEVLIMHQRAQPGPAESFPADPPGPHLPDVLIDADWVQAHLDDTGVVPVEVDNDTSAYDKGTSRARSSSTGSRTCRIR